MNAIKLDSSQVCSNLQCVVMKQTVPDCLDACLKEHIRCTPIQEASTHRMLSWMFSKWLTVEKMRCGTLIHLNIHWQKYTIILRWTHFFGHTWNHTHSHTQMWWYFLTELDCYAVFLMFIFTGICKLKVLGTRGLSADVTFFWFDLRNTGLSAWTFLRIPLKWVKHKQCGGEIHLQWNNVSCSLVHFQQMKPDKEKGRQRLKQLIHIPLFTNTQSVQH